MNTTEITLIPQTTSTLANTSETAIRGFLAAQELVATEEKIAVMIRLDHDIDISSTQEDKIERELNKVRYRKGREVSQFIEELPRGFWTHWLIFKLFGVAIQPYDLTKEQRAELNKTRTKLENYRSLFTAVNCAAAFQTSLDGHTKSPEQLLDDPDFSKIPALIWYRLGKSTEKAHSDLLTAAVTNHIKDGESLELKDVVAIQKIAQSKDLHPAEKTQSIRAYLQTKDLKAGFTDDKTIDVSATSVQNNGKTRVLSPEEELEELEKDPEKSIQAILSVPALQSSSANSFESHAIPNSAMPTGVNYAGNVVEESVGVASRREENNGLQVGQEPVPEDKALTVESLLVKNNKLQTQNNELLDEIAELTLRKDMLKADLEEAERDKFSLREMLAIAQRSVGIAEKDKLSLEQKLAIAENDKSLLAQELAIALRAEPEASL